MPRKQSRDEQRSRMLKTFAKWTLGTVKNETATDLQKAARMESADDDGFCVCVTCGKRAHYKTVNAGHFVPGRTNAALFVESPTPNLHVQCAYCNGPKNGNPTEYERFMVETYGQPAVDELKRVCAGTVQYTREEFCEMRLDYRERWKKQLERLQP